MLVKPIITEKTMKDAVNKQYAFAVRQSATKPEIKTAIEKLFGVTVLRIRTAIMAGKGYRSGRRWIFRHHSDWKKAIVTIKSDQKIELFEVPSQEVVDAK